MCSCEGSWVELLLWVQCFGETNVVVAQPVDHSGTRACRSKHLLHMVGISNHQCTITPGAGHVWELLQPTKTPNNKQDTSNSMLCGILKWQHSRLVLFQWVKGGSVPSLCLSLFVLFCLGPQNTNIKKSKLATKQSNAKPQSSRGQ